MTPPVLHATPAPAPARVRLPCCGQLVDGIVPELVTSDPDRVTCPGAVRGPMSRDHLHARIADVLRRSGVEDAERLIRAMEQDRDETAACLLFGRDATARIERGWRETGLAMHIPTADALAERVARIDRALAGNQIGPVSDPPDRMTP